MYNIGMDFIGWTAGFIDGEGHIGLRTLRKNGKVYSYPYLVITQVDITPLERMQELYGGSLRKRKAPTNPKWNQAYEYCLQGEMLRAVLLQSLPFLTVKREIASYALIHFSPAILGA